MTLIKTRRLVRDLRWKTIKSWQKLRGIHKQSNWGPVFTKGAYQKRCVFNEAVELLKSVFPSKFFQNFQCCNNGFKFGIRVEKDTIMTLWVYWHVKSLTCFKRPYLRIIHKILFIILLLYIRHSFLVKGKGKHSV
jgi:hypothetical protein